MEGERVGGRSSTYVRCIWLLDWGAFRSWRWLTHPCRRRTTAADRHGHWLHPLHLLIGKYTLPPDYTQAFH